METISGTAAGVPFTALPPAQATDGPSPLIVTWHMLDAPRTDSAFAAALPMAGVPAWRVHLGMPMCGERMVDGRVDAAVELIRKDALMAYAAPFTFQAADEFPDALAALRDQLPVDDEPIGILGGSLGGAVALEVWARQRTAIKAVALVNPAVRVRSAIEVIEALLGQTYPWTADSRKTADDLDSLPAPETTRRNRRYCLSAANWTIQRSRRTRPTWSMHYATGTRTPTMSS